MTKGNPKDTQIAEEPTTTSIKPPAIILTLAFNYDMALLENALVSCENSKPIQGATSYLLRGTYQND
ncbi:hypothetical protein CDAR_613261 [Caerostris darwini]|uniref:Uncharacterized protein n=1 Tax=Caerostris darwini TaxID=1538125 RepID=A0AAV4UKJ4_9ARAC|nr:hypothetical protein CDAR_613261 [Caerostris darwini]